MKEKTGFSVSKQSGQRSGIDRRKTNLPMEDKEDRRCGTDRRCKWPLFNEWCSPMNRNSNP